MKGRTTAAALALGLLWMSGALAANNHPGWFQQLDSSHDGWLSRQEATADSSLTRHSEVIDSNHDERISRGEMKAVRRARAARFLERF